MDRPSSPSLPWKRLQKADMLLSAGCGGGLFLLYLMGASPTAYVGDSGELTAAVYTLGIPHPSGYPLYVLLGKLWTLLVPWGSIAWRMSLFSALFAAATCAIVMAGCRRIGLSRVPSLFAGLLLAVGPSFWSQANIQRVYSLNAFFVAWTTYLALGWLSSRSRRDFLAAVFVAMLGACNHLFMGIFAVFLVLFAVWHEAQMFRRIGLWVRLAAVAAAGLVPYAYLPLRSLMDPPLDWGNPETIGSWLDVVMRRNFWGRAWLEEPADLLLIAQDYLQGLVLETWWIGALLALAALAAARNFRPAALWAGVMICNLSAVALHGSRSDIFIWHRYYIPSYLMLCFLAALGLERLRPRLKRWTAVALILPMVMAVAYQARFDRSGYRTAEAFSREILAKLPSGSRLIASDDNILFVLIYLKLVEGLRPDVELIKQGVGQADLPTLIFRPEEEPLFLTHHPNWRAPGLEIVPVGLLFQAWRSDLPPPEPLWPELSPLSFDDPPHSREYLTQNLIGHYYFMLGTTSVYRGDWLTARSHFEAAARAAPRNDVLFYNLGLTYSRLGFLEMARQAYQRSLEINPRRLASHKPVRALDRLLEIDAEISRRRQLEAAPDGSGMGEHNNR